MIPEYLKNSILEGIEIEEENLRRRLREVMIRKAGLLCPDGCEAEPANLLPDAELVRNWEKLYQLFWERKLAFLEEQDG